MNREIELKLAVEYAEEIDQLLDQLGSAGTGESVSLAAKVTEKLGIYERHISSFKAAFPEDDSHAWLESLLYYQRGRKELMGQGFVEGVFRNTARSSNDLGASLAAAFVASSRESARLKKAIPFYDQAIQLFEYDGYRYERAMLLDLVGEQSRALADLEVVLRDTDSELYLKARKLKAEIEAKLARTSAEKKGGCFIATAVYLSAEAPQVMTLRRFRDGFLLRSRLGENFVRCYYQRSPAVAAFLGRSKALRSLTRWLVLDPIVLFVSRIYDAQPTTER